MCEKQCDNEHISYSQSFPVTSIASKQENQYKMR